MHLLVAEHFKLVARERVVTNFPVGMLQVAKKYCELVTPPLQLAMFSVVIVALEVPRKIAPCSTALRWLIVVFFLP